MDQAEKNHSTGPKVDDHWKSPEHAKYYLLGVYLSDGTMSHSRFRLSVRDKGFRDITAEALDLLEIKHSCTERERPGGRVSPSGRISRAGTKFYVKVLSSPKGNALSKWMVDFTRSKQHLPHIPSQLLIEVLAGVLDGDGGVSKRHSHVRVSGTKGYLPGLICQLDSLGILVRGPHSSKRTPHHRRYTILLRNFMSAGLYFRMPRKQKIVDQWVADKPRAED